MVNKHCANVDHSMVLRKCQDLITERKRLMARSDDTSVPDVDVVVTSDEVNDLQAKVNAEEEVLKQLKYK